ncbi:MAG: GDP-mannose 4,6-dehydratase [Nocardioides sp.]|nr:NAD-dependent epimerase/dehydratase family protein [Nocardioides sp.]MDI6910876.1 GDP-mannose 4,6-dehydratase [Nocardioides sp.]
MPSRRASQRRAVITGVNGFVGRHVAQSLTDADWSVVGIGHDDQPTEHVGKFVDDYVSADLTREWPSILAPDAVIHLAGLSALTPSFAAPQTYITVNSSMVTHMGEWLLERESPTRVLIVSSGAVYDTREQTPIDEDRRTRTVSPYAVSKVLVEKQAEYYAARGLDMVVARPFNHIGPGQTTGFLLPDLLAGVQASGERPMVVGDLGTRRDYTDVRDVANAYRLLVESDLGDDRVFNVCSGRPVAGSELLEELLRALGRGPIDLIVDEDRFRPTDPREVRGDAGLLRARTGWSPTISLEQTVRDFVAAALTE